MTGSGPDVPDDIEYVCGEHSHALGFCRSCGQFWGGVESFDFRRSGLCDNCEAEWRADAGDDLDDGMDFGEGD